MRRRRSRNRDAVDRGLRKQAALVGYPLPRTATFRYGARRRPAWWRLGLAVLLLGVIGWWLF